MKPAGAANHDCHRLSTCLNQHFPPPGVLAGGGAVRHDARPGAAGPQAEAWMALERRNSEESSGTRNAILDATEAIMREEGYAAVSSRRVAEKAGLKSQLVHY